MKRSKTTEPTLEFYRDLLLAKRAEIVSSFCRGGPVRDSVRVAEDDQAPLLHDEFISLHVKGLDYRKLKQIEAALKRLDEGEYGVCLACGEPISHKRLSALPWACYCIDCQDQAAAA